jgi:superfamily II DNA or RNA helicase
MQHQLSEPQLGRQPHFNPAFMIEQPSMEMFAGFRRAFGAINVKETATEIIVEGVPADVMQRDMAKVWKTSKIAMHMFNTFGRSSFSFYKFFATDVVYMLDLLIQSRTGTSVRVLNNIRKELFEKTWIGKTLPTVDPVGRLNKANYKRFYKTPLDHQYGFLDTYDTVVDQYGLNGYLLAGAAGSGKTMGALYVAEGVDADKIIVICPKNATQRVWQKTVVEEYKEQQSYWVAEFGKPYNNERIVIVHYEALDKLLTLINNGALAANNSVIILDESHNLNEIKSMRTQQFIEVCKKLECKNIIPASGTPVKAMGAELIPLLITLDPLFTDQVQERFRKIFGKDGNKGLDILKNRMGLISYKIEKSALKLDKPIMKTIAVKMPTAKLYTLSAIRTVMDAFIQERVEYYKKRRKDDERFWERCLVLHEDTLRAAAQKMEYKKYRETLKTVIANPDPRYIGEEIAYTNLYEKRYFEPSLPKEMVKEFRDIKSVIKYTKLKIQGECLGRVLGRKRIECHVEMVKHIDFVAIADTTMKKTLVFTSFVEALVAASEQCKSVDLSPLVVYGKTNNELALIVKKFEQDEALNPLIATYNSLSTAVPLVMADTMIMINAPFRAYIQEQAISRIHRIGADTQTTVYQCHLDTGEEANISTRSSDILQWSMSQVEQIMGIKSPFAITESLEDFDVEIANQTGYDDTGAFNAVLGSHFNNYGIDLAGDLPKHSTQSSGFVGW